MKLKKPSQNFILAEQHVAAQLADEQVNPRLDVRQAAAYLGVSITTLNRWRSYSGPAFHKMGGRIFYNLADLRAFRENS